MEIYSVDGCIETFFNTSTTITKAECDIMAASLFGEPVEPVPIQGLCSYTVTAGPNRADIVQFRAGSYALDMEIVNIALLVHSSRFLPRCTYHEQIEGQLPLSVYLIEKRKGACYIETMDMSVEGKAAFEVRQLRTVTDLAKFFAEAWKGAQVVDTAAAGCLHDEFKADLIRLSENLPNRFMRTLNLVLEGLPHIFTLPFVVTHGDLNETNILVDDDGHITAIVDWAEAQILPFGVSLWALEGILGYMDNTGWHYHENSESLRDEFWRVFETDVGGIQSGIMKNISLARMAGCFLRYGFEQDGLVRGRVRETDFALRYAESFCTTDI